MLLGLPARANPAPMRWGGASLAKGKHVLTGIGTLVGLEPEDSASPSKRWSRKRHRWGPAPGSSHQLTATLPLLLAGGCSGPTHGKLTRIDCNVTVSTRVVVTPVLNFTMFGETISRVKQLRFDTLSMTETAATSNKVRTRRPTLDCPPSFVAASTRATRRAQIIASITTTMKRRHVTEIAVQTINF